MICDGYVVVNAVCGFEGNGCGNTDDYYYGCGNNDDYYQGDDGILTKQRTTYSSNANCFVITVLTSTF